MAVTKSTSSIVHQFQAGCIFFLLLSYQGITTVVNKENIKKLEQICSARYSQVGVYLDCLTTLHAALVELENGTLDLSSKMKDTCNKVFVGDAKSIEECIDAFQNAIDIPDIPGPESALTATEVTETNDDDNNDDDGVNDNAQNLN